MYDLAQFTFDPRTEEYIDRHGNRKCAREVLAHDIYDFSFTPFEEKS